MAKRLDPRRTQNAKVDELLDLIAATDDPKFVAKRSVPWRPYHVYPLRLDITHAQRN